MAEFEFPYMREDWLPGSRASFEYHCNESHDSAHAQWWYRSHQRVTVLGVAECDGLWGTMAERAEAGTPKCYVVRWADGFEATVFEDELLVDRRGFCRPDPPRDVTLLPVDEVEDAGAHLLVGSR